MVKFTLDSVAVVILANMHNPAIINPDFLEKNGIVDGAWEPDGNSLLSSPGLALISFRNGVGWQVTPDMCTITQKVNDGFQASYSIHECAKKYIETLPHIPYTALGMNWNVSLELVGELENESLQNWLKTRFFGTGKWQNSIELAGFGIRIASPKPGCNLTLNAREGVISCNFHTDIAPETDRVKVLYSALDERESDQEFLQASLTKYFKEILS